MVHDFIYSFTLIATYHGFLNLHHDTIITISLSLSSSLSFSIWKVLDDYWTFKFLKEAKNLKLDKSTKSNFDSLKEKVCIFFYFAKKGNSYDDAS
jgi:hypothetical protein